MAQKLDRINRFLEGAKRNRRDITSPEGVTLEVDVANHGERLTALVIDLSFLMAGTVFLFVCLMLLLTEKVNGSVGITLILFIAFLLRNLYFIHFELAWQGRTPGKKIVGLKVIDRHGGPLTPGAIVARNLTREVEVFLPLGLYLGLPSAGAGAHFWMMASYLGWIVMISALPFFNSDHLRAGDLIGGTMVISVPRRRLPPDLAQAQTRFVFSRRHLETYGAFELQVLEEVLRRLPSLEGARVLEEVCEKISHKIGWTEAVQSAEVTQFLTAFYTAQRAHLEREQVFGHYRADKTGAPY